MTRSQKHSPVLASKSCRTAASWWSTVVITDAVSISLRSATKPITRVSAAAYATISLRTLQRDIEMGLVKLQTDGYRAAKDSILAFLPFAWTLTVYSDRQDTLHLWHLPLPP